MALLFSPEIRAMLLIPLFGGIFSACALPGGDSEPPLGSTPTSQTESAPASEDPYLLGQAAKLRGDWNTALNRFDEASVAQAESATFWSLVGDTNLAFFEERIAQGESDGLLLQGLQLDAGRAFEKAAALQPSQQLWVAATSAYRNAGEYQRAWDCALEGANQNAEALTFQSKLEFGRAGLALTIETIQAGKGSPAAATTTSEWLQPLTKEGVPGSATLLSDLYAWQGLHTQASQVLISYLSKVPEDSEALGRLKNIHSNDPAKLVQSLELVRNEVPGNGFILWYLGEARFGHQTSARVGQDYLAAYESIDRAEECFLQARTLRPEFADSCDQWLHLVRTARGWALWEEGRVDDAAQAFLAALEAAPSRLEPEASAATLRLGIEAVVGDAFQKRDMRRARSILKRVVQSHDQDAMWWNNLGLACRDIAEPQIKRGTPPEDVMALLEEAWDAYGRAVELAPNDPNILNDHALLAVYYFDHDLDLAEEQLHRTIQLGTKKLQTIDRESEPKVWQYTDMSIGDAWENLARLDLLRYNRTDRAPAYLDESVKHYPFAVRNGVAYLRTVLAEMLNK
ncbi:MAG: hypothetical protein QGH51_03825 [Planctomycetota bacterium]|nr:hypothetical protein [Planctomycetota bacterium]